MVAARTFRLFMSSTFSDFIAEREALQREVFPRLERYCAERGARFEAVDLRWGITEAAQAEHDTLRICLEEVRRSQELSPRPNFAVLLGDRYGWEPAPARIPLDHWRRLMAAASASDRRLIREAFHSEIDRNLLPPHYWLKARDDTQGQQAQEARERAARDALRRAAERAGFDDAQRIAYFASATHQEIVLGALQIEDANEHVHVYVRRVQDLPVDARASAYRDIDPTTSSPPAGVTDKLRALETELRQRLPGKVHDYATRWTGQDVDLGHLAAFCEDFYQHQVELIDRELRALAVLDPSQERQRQHDQFADERARNFSGRKALRARLRRYTDPARPAGRRPRALVLVGEGGSGKSALLSRAYQDCEAETTRICRFIGGIPGTESIKSLLESLAHDIARHYNTPPARSADTLRDAILAFEGALKLANAQQPLALFLDGLDQLDPGDRAWLLEWLPTPLPPHVRLVASTRPGPIQWAARARSQMVDVPPMGLTDARQMLRALLADTRNAFFNAGATPTRGYRLSTEQTQALLSGLAACGRPLWLKLAYEQAISWRSWQPPDALAPTVEALVEDLVLRRLTERENHPPVFAARALAYLAAGRFGLAEDELAQALGTDPAVRQEFEAQEKTQRRWNDTHRLPPILWSRLFFDLQPYLTQVRMDGTVLYRFFHREFQEAVERLFLSEPDQRREIHGRLADVFRARAPKGDDLFLQTEDGSNTQESAALRRVMEQPWQLARAGQHAELTTLLSDFGFCMAKCAMNRTADLIADYALVPAGRTEAPTWEEFRRFMMSRASLLYRGDRAWPASRILLQLASETPDESFVGQAAARWRSGGWDSRPWLRSHHRQPVVLPSMVLEGHQGNFDSFITLELEDGMLLSRHVNYRLWSLNTGECKATYPISPRVQVIASRADSRFEHPPQGPHGEVLFWSAQPATIRLRHCDAEGTSMCNALELSDGRLLTLRDAKTMQVGSPTQSTPPCILEGHSDDITGFVELADRRILSWGTDTTLRVWTLPSAGSQIATSLTLNLHQAPVLGATQLPSGALVSWDFAGGFAWTELGPKSVSRFLEGMGYDTPPDPKAQRIAYREAYDPNSSWQRGTVGSDHAAAGARWIDCGDEPRLLTWKPGAIHWYDAHARSLCEQTFVVDDAVRLAGVIHLPGFGTARVLDGDENIVLQAYGSDAEITVKEPEARSISGILSLTDTRFCTWSGRKRGDSALRIWSAVDGDWHKGVQLEKRLEGHSRWIHTAATLQGHRIATCGEDDAIRLWDLQVQGHELPQPLEANSPRYIGQGQWRVHLHGYSMADTRRPLILVDALGASARAIDDIWYVRTPPDVIAERGRVIVENELVIDSDNEIIPFESAAAQDVVDGVSRSQSRLQVMEPHLLFALRTLGKESDSEETAGAEVTAWVRTIMDDRYWEAARHTIDLPNLQPLVRLADAAFAAWGAADRVEIWRVSLDDFGQQDVFQSVACLDLPAPPDGVLAWGDEQLLIWSTTGYLLQVEAQTGHILHRLDIPQLAGVHAVAGMPLLAWSQDRQIWRIDSDAGRAHALARSPDADIIGLVTLTPEQFLSLSRDGQLRRWSLQGSDGITSEVLFPGRYMSKAQFFWSMDANEGAGLPAGNPLRDAQGNVLMMTTFAPAAFALVLYARATNTLHLMVIDEDRVKLFDAASPQQALCQWHFPRSSARDSNLELALSPEGELAVLAGTAIEQLSLMRSDQRQRLDTLA
jgi:hypothetical protein